MSRPASTTRGDSDARYALLLGAGAAALLLATRALDQVGDSLAYAYAIKTGWQMFHPHHLLFAPIVRALYVPLSSLGADAVLAAQLHNVFWAVVAIACTYALALRGTGSRALGAAAALALLAARGFAFYATQVEVYVPAAGCAALALWVAVCEGGDPRAGRPWLLAGLVALLVFYHQSNVLFCIPLAFLLGWSGGRAGLRRAASAIGLAGAAVLAVYASAYTIEPGAASVRGFFDYTLRYAVGPYSPEWGTTEAVADAGLGAARDSLLWCIAEISDRPLGRALVQIALAALLAWTVVRLVRSPQHELLRTTALVWLVTYGAFFLWWQPGQHEFFVILLVPLVLLLAHALHDLALLLPARRAAALVAASTIVVCAGWLIPRHLTRVLLPAHRSQGLAHALAQTYFDLAPDCIHLNGRVVTLGLRYYHGFAPDGAMSVRLYRRHFVRPEWRQPIADLPRERCLVIPLAEVLPPGGRERLHDDPAGWFDYYRWLFRAERVNGTVRVQPLTLSEPAGAPLVLIQRGPAREYDGLSGFFEALREDGRLAVLDEWLDSQRDVLRGAVDPVLLGPGT